MAATLQITFQTNLLERNKEICVFWCQFHWRWFVRVQLSKGHHWFMKYLSQFQRGKGHYLSREFILWKTLTTKFVFDVAKLTSKFKDVPVSNYQLLDVQASSLIVFWNRGCTQSLMTNCNYWVLVPLISTRVSGYSQVILLTVICTTSGSNWLKQFFMQIQLHVWPYCCWGQFILEELAWQLMTPLPVSPSHQQQWYWLWNRDAGNHEWHTEDHSEGLSVLVENIFFYWNLILTPWELVSSLINWIGTHHCACRCPGIYQCQAICRQWWLQD